MVEIQKMTVCEHGPGGGGGGGIIKYTLQAQLFAIM
jgi:hypothetical protein